MQIEKVRQRGIALAPTTQPRTAAVVRTRDGAKLFLSRRIPYLKLVDEAVSHSQTASHRITPHRLP